MENDLNEQTKRLRASYGLPQKEPTARRKSSGIHVKLSTEMTRSERLQHSLIEMVSAIYILLTFPLIWITVAWPIVLGIVLSALFDHRGGPAFVGLIAFIIGNKIICRPLANALSEWIGRFPRWLDHFDPAIYEE